MTDPRMVETMFKAPPDVPWAKARKLALTRDGNRCQAFRFGIESACAHIGALNVHHRLPRSRGGRNSQDNLITLCDGHHTYVHHRYEESITSGLLIATSAEDLDELEFGAEMAPTVLRIRMALAEAGYPDAYVFVESTGIFCSDDTPDAVFWRACDLVNEADERERRA